MTKLPVYKGWTVDFRLKEFRKWPSTEDLEKDHITGRTKNLKCFWKSVSFESDQGDRLLSEMIKKDLVPKETLVNLF